MKEPAFNRGRYARRRGKPATANPYQRATQRAAWSAGWNSLGLYFRTVGELKAERQARNAARQAREAEWVRNRLAVLASASKFPGRA